LWVFQFLSSNAPIWTSTSLQSVVNDGLISCSLYIASAVW
jgi:hypothetical protein